MNFLLCCSGNNSNSNNNNRKMLSRNPFSEFDWKGRSVLYFNEKTKKNNSCSIPRWTRRRSWPEIQLELKEGGIKTSFSFRGWITVRYIIISRVFFFTVVVMATANGCHGGLFNSKSGHTVHHCRWVFRVLIVADDEVIAARLNCSITLNQRTLRCLTTLWIDS